MKKILIILVGLICLVLESTFAKIIEPYVYQSKFDFVLHSTIIFLIFFMIYSNKTMGLVLSVIFGFIYDVVYIEIIGIYLASMPLVLFFSSKLSSLFQKSLYATSLVALFASIVLEVIIYGIYFLIGMTDMTLPYFVEYRLLPTTIVSLVFILVFAYPFSKLLAMWESNEHEIVFSKK